MIKKPYLIIPHLVEQPTWGGEYICEMKGWSERAEHKGKKYGQSYELSGTSLLATEEGSIPVSSFAESRPFPLIKLTQAKGNSFQLHVKPGTNEPYWQPKAESWYFFEKGKITYGVKRGADMQKYKNACLEIECYMKELSAAFVKKEITKEEADSQSKQYIHEKNPWQFVNTHTVQKGDIVDLNGGGLHHSWEDDPDNTRGNIVYEVQQDVMDPVSTLRSFDQGKISENGTIREIQIEKYFEHLDTDEKRNTLITQKNKNGALFNTPYYSLSLLSLAQDKNMESTSSFHHLFVQTGRAEIRDAQDHMVTVGRGHSCFIPQGLSYVIQPQTASEVLLTFLR